MTPVVVAVTHKWGSERGRAESEHLTEHLQTARWRWHWPCRRRGCKQQAVSAMPLSYRQSRFCIQRECRAIYLRVASFSVLRSFVAKMRFKSLIICTVKWYYSAGVEVAYLNSIWIPLMVTILWIYSTSHAVGGGGGGGRTSSNMAGFAAQAALRSKWGDLVDSGTSGLPEPSEAITGLKNVVGWLKQVSSRLPYLFHPLMCFLSSLLLPF